MTPPRISVTDKLRELGAPANEAKWANLQRLARLLALKRGRGGRANLGHWWRGPLLYTLVQRHRPKQILEIGTGRGFGAACMAQALADADIDGTVWTLDHVAPDVSQAWLLDEGRGPVTRQLSCEQVWSRHLDRAVRARIRCLTGKSKALLERWQTDGLPEIDFCFIDGGHDYDTVKGDLRAALAISRRGCPLIFDDYGPRRGFGIERVLTEDVLSAAPAASVEIIDLLSRDRTAFGEDLAHCMALVLGMP